MYEVIHRHHVLQLLKTNILVKLFITPNLISLPLLLFSVSVFIPPPLLPTTTTPPPKGSLICSLVPFFLLSQLTHSFLSSTFLFFPFLSFPSSSYVIPSFLLVENLKYISCISHTLLEGVATVYHLLISPDYSILINIFQ